MIRGPLKRVERAERASYYRWRLSLDCGHVVLRLVKRRRVWSQSVADPVPKKARCEECGRAGGVSEPKISIELQGMLGSEDLVWRSLVVVSFEDGYYHQFVVREYLDDGATKEVARAHAEDALSEGREEYVAFARAQRSSRVR